MKDVHKSGLLTTYISDHFPIFSMKTNSLSTNKTSQVFRNFSTVNTREFHSKLQTESCQTVISSQEPQIAYAKFSKIISKRYTSSLPLHSKVPSKRDDNHWVTPALKVSIKNKNLLYIKYKRTPILYNEVKHKDYKR
jgi:hypothetical protein